MEDWLLIVINCFFPKTNVEIYNYDTNEYTIIQDEESLKGDVTATNKSKNYIINMSLDSLKTDKSNQLLITNINNLNKNKNNTIIHPIIEIPNIHIKSSKNKDELNVGMKDFIKLD